MALEVGFDENYDPANFDKPAAGKYHVQIVRVEEEGGSRGEMIVDYEILAGTTADQEGKVHRDYYTKTVKAMSRIHQLAMACGMVTADELREMKKSGKSPVYDFEGAAINKQIFVELFDDEYEGKTRVKCGFGIYHPADPKVAKWPKNAKMLERAGYTVEPQKKPAPQPAPAPAATPAPATSPDELDLDGVV